MDGGRLLQCALWPWKGYRQATLTAVTVGFLFMLGLAVYGILSKEFLFLLLAWFVRETRRSLPRGRRSSRALSRAPLSTTAARSTGGAIGAARA